MRSYRELNSAWPEPCPVPSSQEAITGTKRLIRRAFALAREEGVVTGPYGRYITRVRFKITTGRRITWCRRGVWHVNPNEKRFGGQGGWAEIVHSVSHWAHRRFWPQSKPHAPRHVSIEGELAAYAIANFLDGQLKRPERVKAPVDIKTVRAARVAARIKAWRTKRKRAETALRKLRRQAKHYGLTIVATQDGWTVRLP